MTKYYPALFAFLLGALVVSIPLIAVLLVAVPLFGFAFSYSAMIYRLSRMPHDSMVVELGGEPGFNSVSGYMFKQRGRIVEVFRH